jgi:D-glycero-alpha-D-manno-heptose 1-phosphate guanylyltransferase
MEAIVLAGGLGTRLAARVKDLPKAMAPVGQRPFLEIIRRQLQRSGYARVVISVGHLRESIINYFGTAFDGLSLTYAVEEAPLGTGGGIRKALSMAEEDAALVLNGDTFLDADYAAMMRFHTQAARPMTMAITQQENIARYGGVLTCGGLVTGFEEKGRSGPGWINAGAYILAGNLVWPAGLGEKFSFEMDFLAPQVANLAPAAFEVHGFFLDIGVPEDYDCAQTALEKLADQKQAGE